MNPTPPYIHPMSAPAPAAPASVGGKVQPASPRGPKLPAARTVKVKAHTRTVRPKAPRQPRVTQQQDPYAAQVQNAVDLKYGPQLAAVDQNVRNAQYAQIRSSNWYHDYVNSLNANLAQQNAAANNLATSLNGYNPQAAQTGNPQGDALAQQAQQSQHFLGQAFAGQQGQLALNTANQFATGLIPGANLQNQLVQQNLGNQIGQAQTQRGQLKAQAGEYGQQVRGSLQAAAQKESDVQAALGIKNKTLDYLNGYRGAQLGIQQQNANTTRSKAKTDAKLGRQKLRATNKQDAVNNAFKENSLALQAYKLAHPNLKNASGQTVAQKFQQGIDRGEAVIRLLHSTPPSRDPVTKQVTKPNPFYNLNPQQMASHKEDLIAMLQASAKAGHLTKEQATKAVNAWIKNQGGGHGNDLGQIVGGLLKKLGK